LLSGGEAMSAVIPESVEDLVILRAGRVDLHQVKTRDESQGAWTTAEVLPILCKLYHHRNAFPAPTYEFHFVSDGRADTRTQLKVGSYGALYRLKELLEIRHGGLELSLEEQEEFDSLQQAIIPHIQGLMLDKHGESTTEETARSLLNATWIDTNSDTLRMPDCVNALATALEDDRYGAVQYSTAQVREMHGRVLGIIGKIRKNTIAERRVELQDVLDCRSSASHLEAINLDGVSGASVWEKKAFLGGFDPTELPAFNRLRLRAKATLRQLAPLGFSEELGRLTSSLIDQQIVCRDEVCRSEGLKQNVGPEILRRFRARLPATVAGSPPLQAHIDEQLCIGIAWEETDNCTLWWHALVIQNGER
jgi:hypothetical protein